VARTLEPNLSEKVIAAYKVEDASIDPFKLSLLHMSQAISLGSILLRRTKVVGFDIHDNKIQRVRIKNLETGAESQIEADQVVNCSGAWAGEICKMAGIDVRILYSKGTLLVTNDRLNHGIVNRLRPPSNADIIVPGGTVSIIGTTSIQVENPDNIHTTVEETDLIVQEGVIMMPALEQSRFVRAYCGVRPLVYVGTGDGPVDGRSVSRGYSLFNHSDENVENFITITGGKLTTFRLMAEKTTDLVCGKMGIDAPCVTASQPLPVTDECQWTEPGLSPKRWMRSHDTDDIMLCECEMVPKSTIDEVVSSIKNNNEKPSLADICMRTRLGRGACQGAFCGTRSLAYLYESGEFKGKEGLVDIGKFFQERWKGVHSILWGDQLIQAELMESIHCGLFDEELYTP
jgi:glycerol-3-phosphate dehydrogenase